MHEATKTCVAKAVSLISNGGTDDLRYASIQLRMGIVHLFYELIPRYSDELPQDIVSKWQPRQILDALVECDPDVTKDASYVIRRELPGGSAGEPVLHGHQIAVSKRLLQKHYHKLGFYLHAPVDGKQPAAEKWKKFLQKTIDVLDKYNSTTIANFGVKFRIECDCGCTFMRKSSAIRQNPVVKCLDPKCGAVFHCTFNEPNKVAVNPVERSIVCSHCDTENFFGVQHVRHDAEIVCVECEQKSRIVIAYCSERIDGKLEPIRE